MQPTYPGQPPRDRFGRAVFVLLCTAVFLVISGCAAYVVICVMA